MGDSIQGHTLDRAFHMEHHYKDHIPFASCKLQKRKIRKGEISKKSTYD